MDQDITVNNNNCEAAGGEFLFILKIVDDLTLYLILLYAHGVTHSGVMPQPRLHISNE
jgi:hypothetical protein